MNWSETFQNFIDSYIEFDKIDKDLIEKNIEECFKEETNIDYRIFNKIKLKTNWVSSSNFSFCVNYFGGEENFYLNILDTNSEHNKIRSIFENYLKKHLSIPYSKFFIGDNYKINRIKLEKIKYFIECERPEKEYIKFNPNLNDKMEIKKLIQRSNIKLLFRPALCGNNNILTFKLDAIIVDYNPKELFKYDFIKKIFEARKIKNKENFKNFIEKIKEDRVYIDSRFNKFKFSKDKLKNSNDKILEILNS